MYIKIMKETWLTAVFFHGVNIIKKNVMYVSLKV